MLFVLQMKMKQHFIFVGHVTNFEVKDSPSPLICTTCLGLDLINIFQIVLLVPCLSSDIDIDGNCGWKLQSGPPGYVAHGAFAVGVGRIQQGCSNGLWGICSILVLVGVGRGSTRPLFGLSVGSLWWGGWALCQFGWVADR